MLGRRDNPTATVGANTIKIISNLTFRRKKLNWLLLSFFSLAVLSSLLVPIGLNLAQVKKLKSRHPCVMLSTSSTYFIILSSGWTTCNPKRYFNEIELQKNWMVEQYKKKNINSNNLSPSLFNIQQCLMSKNFFFRQKNLKVDRNKKSHRRFFFFFVRKLFRTNRVSWLPTTEKGEIFSTSTSKTSSTTSTSPFSASLRCVGRGDRRFAGSRGLREEQKKGKDLGCRKRNQREGREEVEKG